MLNCHWVATPSSWNGSSRPDWGSVLNTPVALTGVVIATDCGSVRTITVWNGSGPITTWLTPVLDRVALMSLARRDERDHRDADLLDQPQVVAGEVLVEQRQRGAEVHHPGLAELLEVDRVELGEGDRLGQLELALVGAEVVLVELGDVLAQLLGAGQAHGVCAGRAGGGQVGRGRLPVAGLDVPGGARWRSKAIWFSASRATAVACCRKKL